MPVAALVLAILGIITCWIPYVGFLGVALGLVALVLGIISMKSASGNKGLGIVGVVVGALALLVGGIVQTLTVVVTDYVVDEAPALIDSVTQGQQQVPFTAPGAPAQQIPAEAPIRQ